jgi:hypothetical protein
MTLFLGHVDLFASGAENFDSGGANVFAHTDGQDVLSFTKNSRTYTEDSLEVLFFHEGKAFGSEYEPGMNESVNISGLLIDGEISELKG